jgi:folate-binding Fe-S cluster repair protein YgfZ
MNDDLRGLIELRGEDSLKFLQGQVTCDLNTLEPNQVLSGSHCTPKGRVIFLFSALLLADRSSCP